MTERTPPRLLELAAGPAADAIVAQLVEWGYLAEATAITGGEQP